MDELQSQLELLIEQWRQAISAREKAKRLQMIVSLMSRSEKLWRGGSGTSRDVYQEALQNNWTWFIANLANYDSSRATVMHWFNAYLKWKILDLQKPTKSSKIDLYESSESSGFSTSFNQMKRCIHGHQPQLRRHAMQKRIDVSCDRIMAALLERVEQAPSSQALSEIFAELANEWQLERDAFRRFCTTSCFQLLQKICPNPLY